MTGKQEFETIEIDSQNGGLVITKQERIAFENVQAIEDVEKALEKELISIVNQIKALKAQAQEKRNLLIKIRGEKKAGPIDPAPEQLPAQR